MDFKNIINFEKNFIRFLNFRKYFFFFVKKLNLKSKTGECPGFCRPIFMWNSNKIKLNITQNKSSLLMKFGKFNEIENPQHSGIKTKSTIFGLRFQLFFAKKIA